MKSIRIIAAGMVLGGLCAGQALAHAGLSAGIAKPIEKTGLTKVQFKLPFGLSANKVRRMLERDGYTEIDLTYVGIIDAKADVCRNGTRYRVKIRANGSYKYRNKIGECRPIIKADDVEQIIRREGFRRVDVNDDGRLPYDASGCRRGDRYAIEVNEYGDVKVKNRIGRCDNERESLSPRDLRAALRKDGYDRIKFTTRTRRRFIVEACDNRNRRIRLEINRRGRVRDRQRIGRCPARIRPRDLTGILERDGYNRIDVVDNKPPRYRVEACTSNNRRVRIAFSPWGERIAERKIGDCTPPATIASLTDQLKRNTSNFKGIRVREGKRHPFIADVCDDGQRRELYFSRWGEFIDKKDIGSCISPRLSDVVDQLRSNGLSDVRIYIEGCRDRRGRKIRITVDEYGNRLDRERIGRCN